MAHEGNKYALGNPGGGRPSAYQESESARWALMLWRQEQEKQRLEDKIASGFYSGRDMFALMVLRGNEKMQKVLADKLLPDKLEVVTPKDLNPLTDEQAKKFALIREEYEAKLRAELSSGEPKVTVLSD